MVQHDPFFWDTVQLGSKHAHFFYANGLHWAPLPEAIDSGHPPVFGYYLACLWHFFGKTLPVSHWAMLPFLLLNSTFLYRIGRHIGGRKWAWWLVPIVLLDPVLAGQNTLISPDVVVVSGFLGAFWGILKQKRWCVGLGVFLLCAISLRGMMTAGALFIWCVYLTAGKFTATSWPITVVSAIRTTTPLFIPGFAFAAWFLWWHWQNTGWIGFHAGSAWAPAFAAVDAAGFFRNTAIVGWRWLAFGRIFEWLIFLLVIIKFSKKILTEENKKAITPLIALFVLLLFFLLPAPLRYHNLSAHRYFLPAFLVFHIVVFQWITKARRPALLLFGVVLGLATGNLWIYPRGISMDWDSTLAQQAYPGQRAAAVAYLDRHQVDFQTVGSAFPNLNTGENLLLNGDMRCFAELNFERNRFVFASNVYNDLSAADYAILAADWALCYRSQHAGVWIEIYAQK